MAQEPVVAEVAPMKERQAERRQGGLDLYNFTESLADQISANTIQEYWLKRRITLGMTANRLMTLVSGFPIKPDSQMRSQSSPRKNTSTTLWSEPP